MRALFMRHGQTNYNQLGLCNDDPQVDVHLDTMGIAQAEAAAGKLQGLAIDLIVVSELPRTRQTAEIINRYHHAPIQTHWRLNDIRSGFDSKSVQEYFAAIAADPLHIGVNGGESLLEHKNRVIPYLDWLAHQPLPIVLTVAHEETLRVFYAHFHRLPDSQLRELHFQNCEVFEQALYSIAQ